MCTNFNTKTDATQNLIDDFFFYFGGQKNFHRKDFKWKKYGVTGLLSEKTEALHAELNKRAEAATSSYFAEVEFLQYIYSVLLAKNH